MITRLLGAAVLATFGAAGFAQAADLTAVEAAPAAFNWSGFYAGVHGGYGWADLDGDYFTPAESPQPDGFFGGGQLGYNYQFANNVVVGIEADAAFADLTDDTGYSGTSPGPFTFDYQAKVESFGTVRGRLGYDVDRFLPYVTGGFAWANTKLDTQYTGAPLSSHGSDTQTFTGWTVGAGFEYALASNVTAKVEYLYADLGSKDFHLGDAGPFPADLTMQTAKFGLNYKF